MTGFNRFRNNSGRLLGWSYQILCFMLISTTVYAVNGNGEDPAGKVSAPIVPAGMRIVSPGRIYEICVKMNRGDALQYHFDSNVPLVFNLHYHEGKQVIAPVVDHETVAEQGDFVASIKQEYCLMWTNNGKRHAQLHISYGIGPAQ